MKDFNKGVTTQPQIAYEKPINGSYTYTFSGNVVVTEPSIPEPKEDPANGHAYVDLGLPSGTKWATMNVGASSETDYGLYFAWGDTQGYTASQVGSGSGQKAFTWADYKFNPSGDGSTFTKYNSTDGNTVLDLEDDAVAVNWGGSWHMPTQAQLQELLDTANCTNEWTTVNGVNGRLFTSVSNGNTLFIPAAGYADNGSVGGVGGEGYVWTSSLLSSNVGSAWYLYFGNGDVDLSDDYRCDGFSVRGVLDTPKEQSEGRGFKLKPGLTEKEDIARYIADLSSNRDAVIDIIFN